MNTPFRIGSGFDIHRLVEGRPLVLGGVTIPSPAGLDGHSDADCLTHALADALLGAVGEPDIGHAFPPDDENCRGIDSQKILAFAGKQVRERGYGIANLDATLIAEQPKIGPHLTAMKNTLAATLGIEPSQVGLKATTHEKLGDLGRGLGIAAHAVALIMREETTP